MANFCRYCGSALEAGKDCTCPESMSAKTAAAAQQQAETQPSMPTSPEVQTDMPQQPVQPTPTVVYSPKPMPQRPVAAQQPVPPQSYPANSTTGYPQQPYSYPPDGTTPAQPNPSYQKAAEMTKQVKTGVLAYFKSPVEATRAATSGSPVVPTATAVALMLMLGILFYRMVSTMTQAILSLSGLSEASDQIFVSLPSTILTGALMGAALFAVSVGLLFAVLKLGGMAVSIGQVYRACGMNAVYPTAALLLAAITVSTSVKLTGVLVLLALCAWCVGGMIVLKAFSAPEKNAIYLGYIAAIALSIMVLGVSASQTMQSEMNHVKVQVGTDYISIKDITNGGLENLLKERLNDMMGMGSGFEGEAQTQSEGFPFS